MGIIEQTSAMKITYGGDQATVTGSLWGDPGPVGVLLAHGAGAGREHPWVTTVAGGLAARGLLVLTFDYRYTEAGRKSPDRLPTLLAVHRAAADALAERSERVVLAGKSMGGRVGAHLAGDEDWPAAGLVYYGYPLVAMGKTDPRPTDHLERIEAPQLFFAGTRDRLGPPELIEQVAATLADAEVIVVDDGDHSFKVPKRAGKSNEEVLGEIVAETSAWIEASVGH
jgi:predicted alpha/beta-hydrolase family hydrolase